MIKEFVKFTELISGQRCNPGYEKTFLRRYWNGLVCRKLNHPVEKFAIVGRGWGNFSDHHVDWICTRCGAHFSSLDKLKFVKPCLTPYSLVRCKGGIINKLICTSNIL